MLPALKVGSAIEPPQLMSQSLLARILISPSVRLVVRFQLPSSSLYNIVLIGFMGAGKSTISDFLRDCFCHGRGRDGSEHRRERRNVHLRYSLRPTERSTFRNLETELLIEMQSRSNVVISCGGGVPNVESAM